MEAVIPTGLHPAKEDEVPSNHFITPLLTDMYQVTMCYAYWKSGKHEDHSVFDVFFRKNPFHGEFTIFGGLEDVIKFLQSYKITEDQLEYLKKILPDSDEEFFDYVRGLDCSQVKVYGVPEGTIVFPRVPVLRVEGPLGICQLLETTLLNLCNYASLMTTNACRFRLAAGRDKKLLEFGLRRAQGPDGGMTASRYAFMGGFDATSNVQAGYLYDIATSGTHAHAFVSAYTSFDDIHDWTFHGVNMVEEALKYRKEMNYANASDSELAAFVAYAKAFPRNFLALVDTYETLSSGVPNFIAVALVLEKIGYKATGVRIDSGDLAYLSKEIRKMFHKADARFGTELAKCTIVASNDINEAVLHSLGEQGHEVDAFGIGTHLVTCQAQPALGMVYKLVEVNGTARIKLSQEITKVTLPGAKEAYRLFGTEGVPLGDLLVRAGEGRPKPQKKVLCRHPFDEKKRVYINPKKVLPLLGLVWVGKNCHISDTDIEDEKARMEALKHFFSENGNEYIAEQTGATSFEGSSFTLSDIREGRATHSLRCALPSLQQLRNYVEAQIDLMRSDHIRPLNPTPYKVSVSVELYQFIHDLWMREVPIAELE